MSHGKARNGNDSKGQLERMARPINPFSDIERLFECFFGRRWPVTGLERPLAEISQFGPNVDVIDRDEEVVVHAEVPCFKKDDIEISVSGNMITLNSETETQEKDERATITAARFRGGHLSVRCHCRRTLMNKAKASRHIYAGLVDRKYV